MRSVFSLCILVTACSEPGAGFGTDDANVNTDGGALNDAQAAPLDGAAPERDSASGPPAPPEGPAGCVESLDDCFSTELWADCGGQGDVAFGCTAFNECRWFAHRCAPNGFYLSKCHSDDICCDEGEPFAVDSEVPAASLFTNYWGNRPWTLDRARVIEVRVNPALKDVPSSDDRFEARIARDHILFRDQEGTGYTAWTFDIEIDPLARKARACSAFQDDVVEICAMTNEPTCAVSGFVEVSRMPTARDALLSDVVLNAQLTLSDGRVVTVVP